MTSTIDAGQAPVGPGAGVTPTPAPEQTPQTAALAPSITQAIQNAVTAAPELKEDPGTAVAVGAAGGTAVKAQAVAQAGKRQANATAQDMVKPTGTGLFGGIVSGAESSLSMVAHYANDGLSTVQHEYRYLHDVEARHGMTAAVMEGAGMLGGAAIGTLIEPGEGTVLGAEGAAYLEGQLTYKDSWQRTLNPSYKDPHTGQLVSFGRDVASYTGLRGGERTAVSGALDGLGDLFADPVAWVGKGLGAAHSVEGMGGLLGRRFTGISTATAETVDQAYATLPSVRRAFADIAASTPADIARNYPQFQSVANTLGAAHTPEEVLGVFHDLASANEVLDASKLPTLAASRLAFRPLRDIVANLPNDAEGPVSGFLAHHVINNSIIGPRRWADRLTALPGASFDPESMDFGGSQLNPANTRGLTDLYRMMRFSSTDQEARAVVDAYAAATPAQRITIVKNSIFKMLFRMAGESLPANDAYEDALAELVDGRTKKALLERMENYISSAAIEGNQPERVYATMPDGNVVAPVLDEEGVRVQGGIRSNQTGNISIPNIVEARRMAAAISQARTSRFLGWTDDFLYNNVTQKFFKPLVLMSGGYGLHISLSEAIPNALRRGIPDTLNTIYLRALSDLGYRAETEDLGAITGWLHEIGGERLIRNSDDARYLVQMKLANGGYWTTPGVGAGEALVGETQQVRRALTGFRQKMRESAEFSTFGNEDPRVLKLWQADLREAAKDRWTRTAAQAYLDAAQRGENELAATEAARQAVVEDLRNEPDAVVANYVRSRYKRANAPAAWDAKDDWAQAIVDALKTDVHARGADGAAGELHVDLLRQVANGRVPDIEDLEAIDPSMRPLQLKGRLVVPQGTSTIQTIANFGFHKILNPMVNFLSRNQEFAAEYLEARRPLQELVDSGRMTEDQALVTAESQASVRAMRFVHNLHDRTQWTETMRNWAPFYFAQEQAYRRMGRLLAEDPGAFRRYQLMISAVARISATMQDSNGNSYIAFPGSGFIGKGVADMMGMHGAMVGGVTPSVFGGSLSSANVIFPLSQGYAPDLGPVAILPASALSTHFLELGKRYPQFSKPANLTAAALQYVEGNSSQSEPIWEQLIPNAFVGRILEAYNGDDRAFNSSVMEAYQYLDYQQAQAETAWEKDGRKGPMPSIVPAQTAPASVKQDFVNKVRNYVRALYVARAITGMVSPVSSEVEITDFGFPAKLNEEIEKAGSVSTGMSNFLLKYPNAVPWTVVESYVPSNTDSSQPEGYSLSSSQPAMNWIDANQTLLDRYGPAALWLMPQLKDAEYSSTVYNEQIAQGLRVKDTPAQFLSALYVAAGDDLYYDGLAIHEAALTAAGNSSTAVNAEYANWDAWVQQVEKQYPVWAENFTLGVRQTNAQQAIQTLQQMFKQGAAPAEEQSELVGALLQQYETAAAAYQQAGTQSDYYSAQAKVADSWESYVDQVAQARPQLKPVIQSVFKNALKVQT